MSAYAVHAIGARTILDPLLEHDALLVTTVAQH